MLKNTKSYCTVKKAGVILNLSYITMGRGMMNKKIKGFYNLDKERGVEIQEWGNFIKGIINQIR